MASRRRVNLDVAMGDGLDGDSVGSRATSSSNGTSSKLNEKGEKKESILSRHSTTYAWMAASILLMLWGWRFMSYNHASILLSCVDNSCSLTIKPPESRATTKVTFPPKQIVGANIVKTYKDGTVTDLHSHAHHHIHQSKHDKKMEKRPEKHRKSDDAYGPDEHGLYESYNIEFKTLQPQQRQDDDNDRYNDEETENSSLDELLQFAALDETTNNLVLHMRLFNVGQTRRRVRSIISRVNMYTQGKRDKLTVRENSTVAWQGIVAIIFGVFSLLISCLVTSFWDDLMLDDLPPSKTALASAQRKTTPGRHYGGYTGKVHTSRD